MIISVSEIKQHMTCPMLAKYKYVDRRGPDKIEQALEVGTLLHAWFEAVLNGEDGYAAVEALMLEQEYALTPEGQKVADEYTLIAEHTLPLWQRPDDWEIISVEQELRIPVGRHTVVGRLDSVVGWNDGFWHLQHKSMHSSKPVATYSEQQRTDWHECVYQRMAEAAGYTPFMGTILNMVRKLARSTLEKRPETSLALEYLAREPEMVDDALADLAEIIDHIEAMRNGDIRTWKNRSACAGMFGNRLCAYKVVCDGETDIGSPLFVDLPVRYDTDVLQDNVG